MTALCPRLLEGRATPHSLGALTDSPPVAMPCEALAIEVDPLPDRLDTASVP
jgi:hypothetical protein